jgi:hypothetical protein
VSQVYFSEKQEGWRVWSREIGNCCGWIFLTVAKQTGRREMKEDGWHERQEPMAEQKEAAQELNECLSQTVCRARVADTALTTASRARSR